uniref:Vesicle transport protein n=1 Tax=Noctiluca scintillans TaxID=2966 RepID=A0A7S0ZYE5_NOCSC|mmetsp:Transcript_24292/g.63734  ORF Transcript_24292/g.63734 Transcript_24292/m.63734 type:complete len:254 (+) Transcript_24292:87-848(+)
MNIHNIPFSVRPGLGNLFGSESQHSRGSCDDLFNPYTGIETDDSVSRIQSFYDLNGSSVRGIFSSAASSFGWSRPKSTILPLKNSQSALLCHASPSLWDDEDNLGTTCCPNLSIRRRMLGAICLLCLGQCLQASCWFYFGSVMLGFPAKFATCYTLGNFVMMCASLFFSGPTQQMKQIMLKQRGSTLALFMSTMLLTLVTVYSRSFVGRSFLLILFVVVQYMALAWYILSYVPRGQQVAGKVMRKLSCWCCTL